MSGKPGLARPFSTWGGLIEAYQSLGVSADELPVSVILHGGTAYRILKDAAYRVHKNPLAGNPNKLSLPSCEGMVYVLRPVME